MVEDNDNDAWWRQWEDDDNDAGWSFELPIKWSIIPFHWARSETKIKLEHILGEEHKE